METNINMDGKVEWLKSLVSAYEQEQKEAEKKQLDEAEMRELKRKEREEKFKEIFAESVYPILWSYHVKLASAYKELNLNSDNAESLSGLNESKINELRINDSYLRFSLNEEEYLPPIEVEVCIRGDFPKAEWMQFKQVTKAFVGEKCEDFIVNVFQVTA